MIYLLGIDHLIQYNGPVPEFLRERFKKYLKHTVSEYGIGMIAEEFSEEALYSTFQASEGTAEAAAAEKGIAHRYCDPEESDLKRLGIPLYYDVRESVKKRHGITGQFISDDQIRKNIKDETDFEIKSYWSKREAFWFERILDVIHMPILFICGHEHVLRFYSLLRDKGYQSRIIHCFWGKKYFRDYEKLFQMKEYPKESLCI